MNQQDALISIVIPAYNYGHTLRRAVDSVVMQLTNKCELLIINDGSTDNTSEVIAELDNRYPGRILVINQPNSGLAAVRNRGLRETIGQYLVFLDADDELMPNAIALLSKHIQENIHTRLVIGGYFSKRENGKQKIYLPNSLPKDPFDRVKRYLIDKTIRISNGACAMHRSVFDMGVYPEHFRSVEDIPVFAHVLAYYPCTIIDQPLAVIYKHDDSLRHNIGSGVEVGENLVYEIFDKGRLPVNFRCLRKRFEMQRNLSLFRMLAAVNANEQAIVFYGKALKIDIRALFKWSYTRKAIKLFIFTKKS